MAESGATSPEERGPIETQPGRKAGTDRVFEGIPEGFHPAESERVAPGGEDATSHLLLLDRGTFKPAVPQGRSERSGEAYSFRTLSH